MQNDKEAKKDKGLFGWLVLAGLGVLVIVAIVLPWDGIKIKVDWNTVPTVLAPLMLTALFIGRAVEVMISPWRDPGADQKAQELQDAKSSPAAIQRQSDALDDYTQYKGKTRRYAFAFALLLGIAAAMVGIRALWPFLADPNGSFIAPASSTANASGPSGNDPRNPKKAPQETAFIVVDVVLSALLLAGGANGVHSVVTSFTSFFDNNKQQNQAGSN